MEICKSCIDEISRLLAKSATIAGRSNKPAEKNHARLCNLMVKKLQKKSK